MSKFYSVTVKAWKTIVVEVEDCDDEGVAQQVAYDEAFSFCDNIEADSAELLSTPEAIEQAKRHADEVFELEDGE